MPGSLKEEVKKYRVRYSELFGYMPNATIISQHLRLSGRKKTCTRAMATDLLYEVTEDEKAKNE